VSLAGRAPGALGAAERRRTIAHLSPRSPILAGSLRRALTMGASHRQDDEALEATARDFGLADVLTRLGGLDGHVAEAGRNLSTGEARRLLLARTALSNARLWLLDEPEDGLDADGVERLARMLRECTSTVLLVTHNAALARQMDELWIVEDGRLAAAGAPEVVLAGTHANAFRPRSVA
jgi:ABC-type transport system involved in cytochrome bd biosynthesis fused ATPase/permease subunit